MPRYTVTISRLVTERLAAIIAVPANDEAQAIERAKSAFARGDVLLSFVSADAPQPETYTATQEAVD